MNEWILFCASTCDDLILSGTGQWMHKDNIQPKMLLCLRDSATTVAEPDLLILLFWNKCPTAVGFFADTQ